MLPPRLLRFLSLFGIPLLIYLSSPSERLRRIWRSSGPIPIGPSHPWIPSEDPLIIAHFSDLHISPWLINASVKRVRTALNFVGRNLKPHVLVITGDLADNFDQSPGKYAFHRGDEHRKLYGSVIRSAPVAPERIVEVLGNHDLWGFLEPPKDDMYLLHPITDLVASSRENEGVRIVQFTPVRFPTGNGYYIYFGVITPEALDALERELERPTNASVTFVACHWTSSYFYGVATVRSSRSHRTFSELLRDYGVAAFLNGHEHPPTDYEVIHLGGTIELTATAFKERDGFNVLALDNGRLSYVRLVPGQRSKAMVTSPMRNELATRVFPDHRFQIRVISFSKNATRFNVSGDVTGSLQFQRRTASGAWLYAMDVNLPKGRYSIQISGDLQDKIHFAVGTEVPSFAEFQTLDLALESYPSLVRAAGLYLTLILLGMAFLPRALEVRFEGGYAYMNGDADTGSILGTVFSPLFIGFLLRNFPKFTKRCVVVLAVAPLLVPYRISWIKTAICFQFIWGYYSNGSFIFDPFGAYVAYYYFARIACGYMGFFSLLAFSGRLGRMCEGCLAVLFIASGIRVWERFDFDRPVSNRLLYFSPVFHMVPIMAAVALVVLFFQTRQNRRNSWPWASFVPGATSPPDAIL